ncbi:hypothetical protein V9T40_003777 [Parthenolecanium corni]|uniref:Uncharacterized protein n=1 Tax=Parthenolecanium corni TaxID=536013 RepID=A0AAN9TTC1_9HEMI
MTPPGTSSVNGNTPKTLPRRRESEPCNSKLSLTPTLKDCLTKTTPTRSRLHTPGARFNECSFLHVIINI